jgi:hypothetical protein
MREDETIPLGFLSTLGTPVFTLPHPPAPVEFITYSLEVMEVKKETAEFGGLAHRSSFRGAYPARLASPLSPVGISAHPFSLT